jgi:uncharacterized membrane protein YjfL (UPF0719 family)
MNLVDLVTTGLQNMVYALIVFVFMYIAKIWRDLVTPFNDDEHIVEIQNHAVGLRRAGLYIGLAIGMSGALTGPSLGFGSDVLTLVVDGVIVLVCMIVAQKVCDSLMLHKVKNNYEVGTKHNTAVGFVEAGSYVASGLILYGAFSGEGGGLLSAVIFFAIGQLALLILFWLYQAITPFDVVQEISSENGSINLAAGVAVCGMLISLGYILKSSISGPFTGWGTDLLAFAVSLVVGIVALLVFRLLIDALFLPKTTLAEEIKRDHNVGGLVLTQGAVFAVALIIGSSL